MGNVNLPTPVALAGGALCILGGDAHVHVRVYGNSGGAADYQLHTGDESKAAITHGRVRTPCELNHSPALRDRLSPVIAAKPSGKHSVALSCTLPPGAHMTCATRLGSQLGRRWSGPASVLEEPGRRVRHQLPVLQGLVLAEDGRGIVLGDVHGGLAQDFIRRQGLSFGAMGIGDLHPRRIHRAGRSRSSSSPRGCARR